MSKIEVINSSRKDFSDVEIKIWCDMDSIILVSYGTKKGTVTPLDFTSEYKELESNISKEKKRKFFQTRCYFVPVLNRNDVLEFSCLTTNLKNNEPSLFIDCEHKGLKMENKLLPPLIFWNEPQHLCAIWGLIISGILIIPIFYFLESKIAIGIISFLLGSLLILPGAIFLKLIKKIRKIFY